MLSEPDLNRSRSNASFLKYKNGQFIPSISTLNSFWDFIEGECKRKSGGDSADRSKESLQNVKNSETKAPSGYYSPGDRGIHGGKGFDRCGASASFDCPVNKCEIKVLEVDKIPDELKDDDGLYLTKIQLAEAIIKFGKDTRSFPLRT